MADGVSSIAIYLIAGQKVKIESPIDDSNYMGFFASQEEEIIFKGVKKKLIRGFLVENEDVGEIEATSDDEAAVIYTHKRTEDNTVWFYADTGETSICNIISVPIHDHSSIVQGGPAYGTFFSDDAVD